MSANRNVQSRVILNAPESVPIYSQCLSREPVTSEIFSVKSQISHDNVIPPKLPLVCLVMLRVFLNVEKLLNSVLMFLVLVM
jgi:hypothetical protein